MRRVSVNERSSLYRREHHKEAMVWQERGRQPEEPQDEDEDRQTDAELDPLASPVSLPRAPETRPGERGAWRDVSAAGRTFAQSSALIGRPPDSPHCPANPPAVVSLA